MTRQRYTLWAIVLHWGIAALLLFQISLGWRLEDLPKGMAQFAGYQFHKSVGIAILLLSVLRLAVRLVAPRPAPALGAPAARLLASGVHALLYGVMIVGPLTGWILVSTAKVRMQTMLFGTVPWPDLPVSAGWHDTAQALHGALGWVGVGLIVLHVAGALKHHLAGEDIVARMIPVASRQALHAGLVLAIAGGIAAMAAAKIWSFDAVRPAPSASASASAPEASGPVPVTETSVPATDDASAAPDDTASAAATEAASAAWDWHVAKGGRLGFHVIYSGEPVVGTFSRWNAAIRFSPDDLSRSSIRVTIDLASVSTADAQRDDMLKGGDFFGVATHPQAVFAASRIRADGPGRYAAAGTLTLNGHSQPLTVSFQPGIKGDHADARGNATLRRTAFAVGTGEWASTDALQDAVTIDFAFKADR